MSINPTKQSQFELFPGSSQKPSELIRSGCAFKDLTLSPENIIVLCVVSLMVSVFVYSLGIEKGKNIVKSPDFEALPVDSKLAVEVPADSVKDVQKSEITAQKTQPLEANEAAQKAAPTPVRETFIEAHYTIQVASFKLKDNAEKEAKILKEKGYNAHDVFVIPKGSYSIVCIGKFIEKKDAREIAEKLEYRYRDYLVRRL